MHVITPARLQKFWEEHPNAENSLQLWNQRTAKAKWQNFNELRQLFPSADQVENFTVFNISGNNYRLITLVDYKYQKVFIRNILTHAEYDKEDWKNDSWYTN
ncbi:type II toxin-antitoxin system HigB family toxin [Kamptonema animale CS-326]|jgi:mRNA interferase HigB|uniref:type II toxin-antitoxin system HigB family toxin n=1 Tax=Kamptonema animale TaxID=92934 RepID=UPI00232A9307|nr:type II toxin-antitoxin system HigB family toxin [Kamptonema animale]MDB9512628.1 type II toxin-antitoxin system HigB family toxin [Kamptonema animale CS-326]